MKKIDNRLVVADNTTDLEKMFAAQGELGFSFRSLIPTPFGFKFYFERVSDDDVPAEVLELDNAAVLAKKWGG